jgi:molybdopterin-guanine dinucleotide biosynthesis adapter protein
MGKRVMHILSVIGRSNTGKTTLLEKLIPILRSRGLRIGTVKHHARDFDIDKEGKDSYRHKKAGANVAMITSPEKIALVADADQDYPLEELSKRYMHDIDLVITEGYKREHMPKLEIYVHKEGQKPLADEDPDVIAIAADRLIEAHLPVFLRDDPTPIADFIIKMLKLGSRVKRAGSRVKGQGARVRKGSAKS